MKKLLLTLLSSILLIASVFGVACEKTEKEFTFYAPDGAPAVAIAKFIKDKEDFASGASFNYNVVTSSEISSAITVEQADFVIMPVTTASLVYAEEGGCSKRSGYKMGAVITHGNFYLISSFSLTSVQDLVGKVVLMPNRYGTVPDLTLRAILIDNGLEYVTGDNPVQGKVALSYYTDGSKVIAQMPEDGSADMVAMLPEPAATGIKGKKPIYANRYSVQTAYDSEKNSFPQAVLMVKNSTAEKYPEIVSAIADKFSANVSWVKENPQEAVSAVKAVFEGSTLTNLNTKMIEGCNIYYGKAQEEKQAVKDYLTKLNAIAPSSAKIVTDDFFM